MGIWDKLDRGFKHAAMTIAIPVVTPACLKQASRMRVIFNFLCVFIFWRTE